MRLREVSALACGAALALGATFAAADQVYKWTDNQGHVHFSQTPPPSTTAGVQQVNVNAAPPDPQSLQNQQGLIQAQQDQQKKAKEAADKDKPDPQAEALKKLECDDLRVKLATLQQQGRTATVDAQGNVTYLDDDARAKQEQQIQAQLAKNCSGH
jgi:hypothetical protein